MAILKNCPKCGGEFCTSSELYKTFCDACDGTVERQRAEEEKWMALKIEDKIEQLRHRIEGLENQGLWDGRI